MVVTLLARKIRLHEILLSGMYDFESVIVYYDIGTVLSSFYPVCLIRLMNNTV